MKKILLYISLFSMHLANAGIHSNPTFFQQAKFLARKALKSRATPFVLGCVALSTIPYKKLLRERMANYAYDSGSTYASKWLPWPMSTYLKEWNRAHLREQRQMKISYALFGAAVAIMLMQQSDSTTQQPMIINKVIINNGDVQHEAVDEKLSKGEWTDDSDYL